MYKSVPNRTQRQIIISSVDSKLIIPFSSDEVGDILNLSGNRYAIQIWLENHSGDTAVKIGEITESFKIADPPEAPQTV